MTHPRYPRPARVRAVATSGAPGLLATLAALVAAPAARTRPATRAALPTALAALLASAAGAPGVAAQSGVTHYVRLQAPDGPVWGILEGSTVRVLEGNPVTGDPRPTGETCDTADVSLLAPVETPGKVIAVGFNYRSHLGDDPPATEPGLFWKSPTSIVGPRDDIVYPAEANNLHYEGEMVLVVGRRGKDIPRERAADHVFGVMAGNDVSERDWQSGDLQWFRAKGSDGFGPVGPVLAAGVDFSDLLLQTRVNGEVRQSQRTADLIFDVPAIVSYVSKWVTLEPGDLIFTGTPGSTRAVEPGDVVEVELEGVGTIRNRVVRER